MKKSKYSYFFESGSEYIGYSWIADKYVSFQVQDKERVDRILEDATTVLTNKDARIYAELFDSKIIISNEFNEFQYAYMLHNREIFRTDAIEFTIIPTMQCNCRCPYCYEIHSNEKMKQEVIDNIKGYIQKKSVQIKYLKIAWFGGEPLIALDIIKDIGVFCKEIASDNGVEYISDITTNAVLLDDNACMVLKNAGITTLHVTIDGSELMHNKTRVLIGGDGTYEKVIGNIKRFLKFNEKNSAVIRIHIHNSEADEIEGIKETIKAFENEKKNSSFYLKKIFNSCTEEWGENANNINKIEYEKMENAINELQKFLNQNKFASVEKPIKRHTSCYADKGYSWAVLPDGKLSKCTVAMEKERIPAMLTKDGIAVNMNKNAKWNKKILEARIVNNCADCIKLPFCWGKCPLQNYNSSGKEPLNCKNGGISTGLINDMISDYNKRKRKYEIE